MKTYYTVTLAMLAGAAIGAAAVNGLHAQAKAPLYVVSELDVTNPEAYGKEYAPRAQALIKASGGRFLAIGGVAGAGAGKLTAFDGEAPKRVTVQAWDSMEQYQAYRNLPAFKEARQIGEKYAKFHTFAVEGVSQYRTHHFESVERPSRLAASHDSNTPNFADDQSRLVIGYSASEWTTLDCDQSSRRAISLLRWPSGILNSSIAFSIALRSSACSWMMPINWAGVPRRR